jgi:TonB-dependent receptor
MTSMPTRRARQTRRALLRLSPITAACSTLLLAAGGANAQQAPGVDAAPTQTVVVTGIRRSIESSIAVKRSSDSIVEAISSEDLGKLPEQSVAEALARLPGVVGQRGPSGRIDLISIRGLGPKYGGTVMNGREMVSSNDGRAVEYDQFPSELLNAAVVYKTPDAALMGQGLSGTVDIRTLKPLDLRGRQVVVNANASHNSNDQSVAGGGSTVAKRLSMSYVDQFADNTVGLSLGYAHLDTPAQTVSNKINEYTNPYNNPNCISAGAPGWCPVPAIGLPKQANLGGAFDYAAFPQRFQVFAETKSNVRDGFMATVEFRPHKGLRSQVDLFYSKFESRTVSSGFQAELYNGIWNGDPLDRPVFSNVTTQQAGGNTIVTGGTMDHIANGAINNTSNRSDQTSAIGWNTEYQFADKWKAVADLSYSKNKRDESFYENYASRYADGKFTRGAFNFVTPGTNPDALMKITPAGATSLVDPLAMRIGDPLGYVGGSATSGWAGPIRKPHTDDEIKALRFSVKRSMDGFFSAMDLGVNYSQRDKTVAKNQFDTRMKKDASGNFINTVPASYLRAPADLSAYGVPPVISIDAEALATSGFFDSAQSLWLTVTSDSSVHEKITTGFIKFDIDTDIFGLGLRGNVGTQLVNTKQESTGWTWVGGESRDTVLNLRPISGGKTYNDLLPSLNLVLDLTKDTYLRFGLARTMVRPEINDMRAGANADLKKKAASCVPSVSAPCDASWTTTTAGNPELEPWRANSIDVALDKYVGRHTYASVAYYHKKLLSNIYVKEFQRDFSGVEHDPTLRPVSDLALVQAPANGDGGYVEGVELSGSFDAKLLSPMLEGFGLVASASKVHSSIHAENKPNQPLEGLSGRSSSFTLFYERSGFSARINKTHRSAFLAQTRNWDYTTNYTKTGAEDLVNIQAGYAFESGTFKGLSIAASVSNLTDAALVTHKSVGAQGANPDPEALVPYEVRKFGRQFGVGVGYKF